jgi:hypothetical protein
VLDGLASIAGHPRHGPKFQYLQGGDVMNQTARTGGAIICGLTLCVLGTCQGLAADSVPNMKGKWLGQTHTIVAGVGLHWPSNKGTFAKPGLYEKDLVIEVLGQEGDRFWGNQSFSGNGEKTEEPMIGELTGENNKTVIIVDTDGYINGRLIGNDTLSFCYTQAGGKTESSVVSCTEVKRAR